MLVTSTSRPDGRRLAFVAGSNDVGEREIGEVTGSLERKPVFFVSHGIEPRRLVTTTPGATRVCSLRTAIEHDKPGSAYRGPANGVRPVLRNRDAEFASREFGEGHSTQEGARPGEHSRLFREHVLNRQPAG
jgi:hypothetical protein